MSIDLTRYSMPFRVPGLGTGTPRAVFLVFSGLLLVGITCRGAAAQEGGTSPTCTGCGGAPKHVRTHIAKHPRTRPREQTGSLAVYDGAWAGNSYGACIINGWSWAIQINDGNVSGEGVTGRVSRGGSILGTMLVFGSNYEFRGEVGASQASGTWVVRSGAKAGCAGTWKAVKS
jgi:hypothetical protein